MATKFGYFLIADITGYTQYLSASELDHAQQILTALLNVLIRQTKPPLVISRLAGDAVISYGIREQFVAGQTFIEMLEDTYVSFRRQIEVMVRNTSCECKACQNIPSLDLKFFVHYGEFSIQKLDGHDELVGSDVNMIHRLLKNSVTERTGLKAYTLFSEAALKALGLAEDIPNLIALTESYEHLGEVTIFVEDMRPAWEARRDAMQVGIAPDDEVLRFEAVLRAPPEVVWNNIVQPEAFNVLLGGDKMGLAKRRGSRVAKGTVYNCYHGDALIENVVVGWRPFEQLTLQFALPIPLLEATMLAELRLQAVPEGTALTEIFSKTRGSLPARLAGDGAIKAQQGHFRELFERFVAHVEAEAAEMASVAEGAPIPTAAEVDAAARQSLSA